MSDKPAKLNGLAHAGIFITNLEKSKAFYIEKLDFKLTHENIIETNEGVIKVAFVSLGALTLELVEFPKFDTSRRDGLIDHIAFSVENIEVVVKKLKTKGIQFEGEIYFAKHYWDRGSKWVTFRGPDNEHLELTEVL